MLTSKDYKIIWPRDMIINYFQDGKLILKFLKNNIIPPLGFDFKF